MERRLAAILATDMVAYSRLMEADEERTLNRLIICRRAIYGLIEDRQGRVFGTAGDSVIAEFASPVQAMRCAIEVQHDLEGRNRDLPDDQRMQFRIGVNLGDVMVEGDQLQGDGVAVAARLEALADPGGICISGPLFDQVEGKFDCGFDDLGEQQVKNIAKPVRVFKVLSDTPGAGQAAVAAPAAKRSWRWPMVAGSLAAFVVVVGIVLWQRPWEPRAEPVSEVNMAFPLPDKPSIAVLPFTNMSDVSGQEYFADGMTDDLITDLSKISGLFVIARNSSFSYKGQQVKVSQVAEELGVRYVLEGSIRRAGDQVRINAQLVDTQTGGHIWADRYDGPMASVFALQDKVTANIVSALALTLTITESERLAHRETRNPTAYDAYLQGWTHYRAFTEEDFAKAEVHLLRAIEIDPDYGQAHAALAAIYWNSIYRAWRQNLGWPDAHSQAIRHLDYAMKSPTPLAYRINSRMLLHERKHDDAIAAVEHAIALDPNDADSFALLGHQLIFAGQPEAGVAALREAMRLDPFYPALYLQRLGYANFGLERYEKAVTLFERARKRNPGLNAWMLMAAYGQLGRIEAGKNSLAEYLEYRGWDTWRQVKHILPYFPYKSSTDLERFARGMVKAGLCCSEQITLRPSGLRDLQK